MPGPWERQRRILTPITLSMSATTKVSQALDSRVELFRITTDAAEAVEWLGEDGDVDTDTGYTVATAAPDSGWIDAQDQSLQMKPASATTVVVTIHQIVGV